MTRKKIIIIFGGQSGEHEVSIKSSDSVLQAIDKDEFDVETIGISKEGKWHWGIKPEDWKQDPTQEGIQVTLVHDPSNPRFLALNGSALPNEGKFDLLFPVLHGPFGEDGTIQGLFELAHVPYVGSGVLGSALGMDKDRMKAVFAQARLQQVKYVTLLRSEIRSNPEICLLHIEKELSYPCFIKPANLGSSVGISKAYNREQLQEALDLAGQFDRKIVIEKNIDGREIEVSVLGNDEAIASIPGEILPANDFYDYEAKYLDKGSRLVIPAVLDEETVKRMQKAALSAFHAVEASGLSRVDFFLTANNEIYVNEINTLPGFTQISMYPKLWEASGIAYPDLVRRLIALGFERFSDNNARKISI